MSVSTGIGEPSNYFAQVFALVRLSLAQLLGAPSQSRRAEAARQLWRRVPWLAGFGAMAVVALMFALDATEIALMPPRGSPDLWPVRILTDFGKPSFVLWSLAAVLFVVALISPRLQGMPRLLLISFGIRIQFVFFAVLVPVLAGEVIKLIVGRGRPFVGGVANVFNFMPFAGTEAYASFPSGHATASVALALAITALWPRLRLAMIIYAVLVVASRLVLLAHHPSDVVAGALIGTVGAMVVRNWFAARHLAFTIRRDGTIEPFAGPSRAHLRRVARGAFAP